ncbi:MAG: stage II sporulation protein M [Saprospiraceae bacterium]|nr:stage II sporulation protein M [Saprospiraceae bacterium]
MTESQFIEKNNKKWRELEALLDQSERDADKLHELFIRVSSDLSYARTFYPNRSVRLYLNNLTQRVFDSMTRTESKTSLATILHFFKYTLPKEVIIAKGAFMVSLLIFVVSVAIGIVSTANSPDFARIILGDHYIQITDENINAGDPMAIYKDEQQVDMFLGITINNIKVAFIAFVLGLMGTMGTVFILMYNGIMLGAFQYYFYSKGLFVTSFLTIWIHGTIEISAIIIAGAAGIVLGNGLLFPATYDRLISLQMSAKKALIIVIGTIPLFVIAGILESFVTRHTEFPVVVKATIIIASVILIVSMWVILPMRLKARKALMDTSGELTPEHQPMLSFQALQYRNVSESFVLAFAQIRQLMGPYLKIVVIPSVFIFGLLTGYHLSTLDEAIFELDDSSISLFRFQDGGFSTFIFFWITLTLVFYSLVDTPVIIPHALT